MSFSEPLYRRARCCARTLYHNYNRNTARKYPGSRNAGTCARIPASPNQSRLLCGMLQNDALKRGHPGLLVGAEGIRGTWPQDVPRHCALLKGGATVWRVSKSYANICQQL